MKRIKKFAAALLTAIMMMTMTVTAYAAGGPHSLTVNVKTGEGVPTQTLKDQTINLYKLFDVTESESTTTSGTQKNYAYTVNTDYKDALVKVLGEPITDQSKDEDFANAVLGLGANDSEKVQKFANDFTAEALKKSLTATTKSEKLEDVTSYEFTGLAAGYYLVYVTGGKEIQSSLVTVDAPTNTVNLKTEAPSITKEADKKTVEIGQVVKYTVKGSIPDTTGYADYQYIIHDELSKGLDFVNDEQGTTVTGNAVKVTVAFKEQGVTMARTTPTTTTLSGEGRRTMSLDLSEWVKANSDNNKGKEFTVTYYAKVNTAAVVTEKNSATLEYGNNSGETTKTKPSEAKTPTYPLNINKIKKDSNPEEQLAGATFRLYRNEADAKNGSNPIAVSGSNGKYVVTPNSSEFNLVSVNNQVGTIDEKSFNLQVNGLAARDYWLKEIEAPNGFNKLTDPIKVTITKSTDTNEENWTLTKGDAEQAPRVITVENSTGSLLPSTGGTGVIVFAGVAILLVFGVVVSFIRDKRKAS